MMGVITKALSNWFVITVQVTRMLHSGQVIKTMYVNI